MEQQLLHKTFRGGGIRIKLYKMMYGVEERQRETLFLQNTCKRNGQTPVKLTGPTFRTDQTEILLYAIPNSFLGFAATRWKRKLLVPTLLKGESDHLLLHDVSSNGC